MPTEQFEDVLNFWFPIDSNADQTAILQRWNWWFRGGANAEITERFSLLFERARRGELDDWLSEPRSRLALILILDQFSRSIHPGTAQAFAQDKRACTVAIEGINIGHYATLKTPWEKTFFFLPLGHSEELENLELAVKLANELVQASPQEYHALLTFSASQAHRHQDIIARFGRHPHRNEVLGRRSTPEELEYLASGQLVHTRPLPPDLAHLSAS